MYLLAKGWMTVCTLKTWTQESETTVEVRRESGKNLVFRPGLWILMEKEVGSRA